MASTRERLVESVFSLLERGVALVLEYNEGHPDFPMSAVRLKQHVFVSFPGCRYFFSTPTVRSVVYRGTDSRRTTIDI